MARHRRQGRAAGIPAEMVELVSAVGHVETVKDLAVARGRGVDVHDGERIGSLHMRYGEIDGYSAKARAAWSGSSRNCRIVRPAWRAAKGKLC